MDCARKHGRYGHRDATMILVAYRHELRASEVCDRYNLGPDPDGWEGMLAAPQRCFTSARRSKARRLVTMIDPCETLTILSRFCQLRRHLFTLSRVPPTMFASSR
jgi:hypothetical protein